MSDVSVTLIIPRHLTLMEKTMQLTYSMLDGATHEDVTRYRDGDDGWTVLEVICHLRDYEEIFHRRARMIRDEDTPYLPAYDHNAMVLEREYAKQDLQAVLAALAEERRAYTAFFRGLAEGDWLRAGIHPESGRFMLIQALLQVGHHHVDHLEQIGRILTQRSR